MRIRRSNAFGLSGSRAADQLPAGLAEGVVLLRLFEDSIARRASSSSERAF
jgi:hypothetical protein